LICILYALLCGQNFIPVKSGYYTIPSGLVLELNNYYCIPTLCKNIISSSCLEEVDGYEI
jgi:hypothetical protein